MRYAGGTVIHKQWTINYTIQRYATKLLKVPINFVSSLDAYSLTYLVFLQRCRSCCSRNTAIYMFNRKYETRHETGGRVILQAGIPSNLDALYALNERHASA